MDDRAALLAAVCDRPDDDTPRLVFADWCDDHGDADYARFIRAQVELARVPEWDRLWVRTRRRDLALVTGHTFRDRYPLPEPGQGEAPFQLLANFRRGFPFDVACESAAQFARHADALFTVAPFRSVTIHHDGRGAADLAPLADPRFARLRRLGFVGTRFGPSAVRRLAAVPELAGVTELAFENDALTPAGVAELFRSNLFDRVRRLDLPFADPIPANLFRVYSGPSALRALNLHYTPLAGLRRSLSDSPLLGGLVELNATLSSPGAVISMLADRAPRLESLTLGDAAVNVAAVRGLAEIPAFPALRRLTLQSCQLGPAGAAALAQSPHLRNLTVLDLAGNAIGDKGVLALAESPHLRNLLDLDLMHAELTDRGAAALLESPVTVNLEHLGLLGDQSLSPEMRARVRERFG